MAVVDTFKSIGASPISIGQYHLTANDVPSRRPRTAWVLCDCSVPSWGRWRTMGTGEVAVQVMAMNCHSSNMSSTCWSQQFCAPFSLLVLLVLPAFLIISPKNHTNRAAVFITKDMLGQSHQSWLLRGAVFVWRLVWLHPITKQHALNSNH